MKRFSILFLLGTLLALSVSAAQARAVISSVPSATAALTPAAAGTIAYVVPNDTSGDQIWLAGPDGSNKRKIFSTGKADPYAVQNINGLAWRPDSGELVFASNHEEDCSWYASDLYAIRADGSGYRRVTNAPDCAVLASYPAEKRGSVTMSLPSGAQVYIMGRTEPFWSTGGTMTINNVVDLGDFRQPVVAIQLGNRVMGDPVDVKAGQTVNAGTISFYPPWSDEWGAYGPVWRSDGSKIGYSFGCSALYEIADQPAAGTIGKMLLSTAAGVTPCGIAWGPTPSTASDIVYWNSAGDRGIYRTTETNSSAGTQLIATEDLIMAIRYLPDGSGLLFSAGDNFGASSNLYRYDFGSGSVTQVTNYADQYVRDFVISPDGHNIIFELAPFDWMAPWGGASDLYMMGMGDSAPHLFVAHGAHPSWGLGAIKLPTIDKLYLPLTIKN